MAGLAAVRWIHGSPDGEPSGDPPLQVVALDDSTFVIRQGKQVHEERGGERLGRYLVTPVDGRTAVLGHFSAVTITILTARAVSSAMQNSASERTTTRLVR
jgi:hypothetical protein